MATDAMTDEEIRDYLDDNGYPPHVVRGGSAGLVERWRAFVSEAQAGYRYRLEDYRSDLDLRGVIQVVGLGEDDGVREADERFRQLLKATYIRLWESMAGEPFGTSVTRGTSVGNWRGI